MKTRSRTHFMVVCCALAAGFNFSARLVNAQVLALSFSNDGGFASGYTGTIGWEFTANTEATLTEFGIYNAGAPVTSAHQVGLFSTTGTLLESGTVGPTSGDTVAGYFDFAPATPFNLLPGTSYIIGELLGPADLFYYDPSTVTTDPSITYVQTQYDPNNLNSLTYPSATDFPDNGYGYFGPNFQLASSVSGPPGGTPEPALPCMFVSLLAAAAAARRHVRRRL